MATQKQRRRRAKEKRHDYDIVEIDDEGNETILSASDLKAEPPAEAQPARGRRRRHVDRRSPVAGDAAATIVAARAQAGRDVRADLPRHRAPAQRRPADRSPGPSMQTLLLLAVFVPFSYFMDRIVWRSYQKRLARSK